MIGIITVLLVILAVLLFGFIIFIHEFGHFFTAKLSGIQVNEFAIGMGPTIFHFGKGETRYSLRLFPIGGFCAMEGEDEESENERAYNHKPVWKRILVVVMGAVMNMLLGVIIVMILLAQQPQFATTTIAGFTKNSALQSAGLQQGDRFTSIDGVKIHCDRDLNFALALANPKSADITVQRKGKSVEFNNVKFNTVKQDGKDILSLDFYVLPQKKTFGTLIQKSFVDTYSIFRMVWISLIGMVTGRFGINDVAGPVGAAQMITKAASMGLKTSFLAAFNNMLMIMAMLTINLGVINLLPLPALDGGKLVLLIVEAIRRKPINPKYEGWIDAAGFSILMALLVVVTFNDIFRLITGHGIG